MGVWGPLVKTSVCRCRCVQACTDIGAYTGTGMYVCTAAGVCGHRCVQMCVQLHAGLYRCVKVYIQVQVQVCACVYMCVRLWVHAGVCRSVQAQVCTRVQVRCVWARAHVVHKRSCSCLPLQSSLASSLWGVWFLHLSS